MKILFIDDDEDLLELLSFLAQRANFRPIVATDAPSALRKMDEHRPDLAVLDIRLGADDGLDLLKTIRRSCELPVIMLSSLDSEGEIERALELGADDYLTKPFATRELVARIRAVLRRTGDAQPVQPIDHCLRVGSLALNVREHKATLDGWPLALTRTEFRLLRVLMENIDVVVPYAMLLTQVWGYDDPTATELVRAAVYRLRRKLVDTGSEQALQLRTLAGVGVMLRYAGRPKDQRDRYALLGKTSQITAAA